MTTWPCFLQAIEACFAQSPYEDPTELLCKLTQKGYVPDYLTQFEALANRIVELPTSFLLSYFVSGLDLDIRREDYALQPLTLVHAVGLARLHEEKLLTHHKGSWGRAPTGSSFSLLIPPPAPSPTPNLPLLP